MFSCFWFHNGKKNNGVIINISSDLAVRAPDQGFIHLRIVFMT